MELLLGHPEQVQSGICLTFRLLVDDSLKDINDVSAESWSNSDDTQDKNEGLEEIHPYVKARSVFHCVNGQLHFIFHLANFAKLCNGGFFLKIDRISQKKKATAFKLVVTARDDC